MDQEMALSVRLAKPTLTTMRTRVRTALTVRGLRAATRTPRPNAAAAVAGVGADGAPMRTNVAMSINGARRTRSVKALVKTSMRGGMALDVNPCQKAPVALTTQGRALWPPMHRRLAATGRLKGAGKVDAGVGGGAAVAIRLISPERRSLTLPT